MKHQKIPALEEYFSPLTYGGKTLDRTLDFLQEVYRAIERGEFEEEDTEYEYYLTKFSDTIKGKEVRQIIDGTDENQKPRRNGVRFGAFYLLIIASLEEYVDYGALNNYDDEWGKEFQDRPMYDYLRSLIHRRGFRPQHYRIAVEAGYQSVKEIDSNPQVFLSFSRAITSLCSTHNIGELDIADLSEDRNKLLEVANDYATRAATLAPQDPDAYSTLSSVLAMQERFEEAEEKLNKAISWEIDTEDQPNTSDYKMMMNSIQRDRRHAELTEAAISQTREDINKLSDELDGLVERYRSQTLQFISFFAAIVALVVTSAQIAVTAPSFAEASGLILILIGGILIAFGAFNIAIPRVSSGVPWWRTTMTIIAGIVLIVLGLLAPGIIELLG